MHYWGGQIDQRRYQMKQWTVLKGLSYQSLNEPAPATRWTMHEESSSHGKKNSTANTTYLSCIGGARLESSLSGWSHLGEYSATRVTRPCALITNWVGMGEDKKDWMSSTRRHCQKPQNPATFAQWLQKVLHVFKTPLHCIGLCFCKGEYESWP